MSLEKILVVLSEPRSIVAESYRGLRTSIQRAMSNGVRTIMFVSTFSGDGKSTVCANVAAALTQLFLDVIIIDCDLRRPTVTKVFGDSERIGLSNYLLGQVSLDEIILPTSLERLRVIPAGTATENPGDVLGLPAVKEFCSQIRERCDVAIFDTSPLSACSDALSLGPYLDTAALVVNPKQWDGDVEVNIRQSLDSHNIPVMGIILNGTEPKESHGYGGGRYGYGGKRYGYGSVASDASYGYGYGYGYGYEQGEDASGERPNRARKGLWNKIKSFWGD